jgi:hypothetical protein
MATYDENAGGAYARESGYGSGGEDDEVGVEAAKSGRYNTYRARGFSSGVVDPETGNVVHGGTSALRGVTAGAEDYEEQQRAAQEATEAQQAAEDYALSLTETPYGPAAGMHEDSLTGREVPNKFTRDDYVENIHKGLSPTYNQYQEFKEHGYSTDMLKPENMYNPARQVVEAGNQAVGTVICTELFNQKKMSLELYLADAAQAKDISPHILNGYRFWAVPFVRLMRKYRWATDFIKPFALSRAKHVAYQLGRRSKPDWPGRVIRWIGEPICYVIGLVVGEQDYSVLYKEKEST